MMSDDVMDIVDNEVSLGDVSSKASKLPRWHYTGQKPPQSHSSAGGNSILPDEVLTMDLGNYRRNSVSNVDCGDPMGRTYFDFGLRLMMSYQHEIASKCFLACLELCPDAALAHGLLALCHSPNYNFKGEAYYESACHFDDVGQADLLCVFPSQQVADRHSAAGVEKVEALRRLHTRTNKYHPKKKNHFHGSSKGHKGGKSKANGSASGTYGGDDVASMDNDNNVSVSPGMVTEVERHLLSAIRILTGTPGVDPSLSEETVGRPYAAAMRKVYQRYPDDPEIAYFFAESLMVLNAWQLYEYPSGKPVSVDVEETRDVLERALAMHPHHAGLCHMYVHLSEMSAHPELALIACQPLRSEFKHAGHLIHMPTHIDVLTGDYESCVRYNLHAVEADMYAMKCSPATAGPESFYFGYIVHDYHMAVYGAILGGMETKGMEVALELNAMMNEKMFREHPGIVAYLEAYSSLEIHVMVRFGRWKELLEVELPADKNLMLYRTASIRYARALAYAMTGDLVEASKEADRFDTLRRNHPDVNVRILHNNTVADLLAVDAVMMRGEIAYRQGKHEYGLDLLRKAVDMQENLNYDEPWGKMQPIRHALGGLLLEQEHLEEAESVFRKDLKFHPRNPWSLVGLIRCLKEVELQKLHGAAGGDCCSGETTTMEIAELEEQLRVQRQMEWADYDVVVSCECCVYPET